MIIAYDAVIDGMYRKASSYVAKTVHHQKNKKVDAEAFLYKIEQGIVDTDMLVAPISGVTATQGEAAETIGTMELRLYITRQLGVSYTLGSIEKYSNTSGNIEDEDLRSASYKLIPPTLQMTFEKNSAPLEKSKVSREQRKMDSRRPGTEPWAIFRFHYRNKG